MGEQAVGLPPLVGPEGESHSLESYGRYGALVLAFLGNACPAVKACTQSLVRLQSSFASRGGQVLGLNPNNPYLSPTDTLAEMTRWSSEHRLNFPYLKDPEGGWARRLGVTNTPQFVVLDRERRLRYRGRLFDSRDPARATTHDLEEALEAVLFERPVVVAETNPLGCSIVW